MDVIFRKMPFAHPPEPGEGELLLCPEPRHADRRRALSRLIVERGVETLLEGPGQIRALVVACYPTLDDMISEDHPVRLYEEILCGLDWREWESQYDGKRGPPPIHPRILCGAILYGLRHRIRSSRQLEDACINRLDFKWLVGGTGDRPFHVCRFSEAIWGGDQRHREAGESSGIEDGFHCVRDGGDGWDAGEGE